MVFILFFFSRHISLYELYSGIVAAVFHMTSMRARPRPPLFTRALSKITPDTTIQNYLLNK